MKRDDLYIAAKGDVVKIKNKIGIIHEIWNTNRTCIHPEDVRIWISIPGDADGCKEYSYKSITLLGYNANAFNELADYCKNICKQQCNQSKI